MLNSLLLITSAAALLPSLALGLVGISWNVTNVPSSGLRSIAFPFSIANAPHKTGYYFVQQFNFIGQSDVGYTGLQPRPDSNYNPIIRAAFSNFINGTTHGDPNCHYGADGGPGVSCAVEFSASYANGYRIEVVNIYGNTWTGTVVDTTTGMRVHIGAWTLPAGTDGIRSSQVGFIEYYLWNGQHHACSSLPYTSMVFGVPLTTTSGAIGSLGDAYECGDCVGQVDFRTHRTSDQGVAVSVRFVTRVMTYLQLALGF